MNNPKMKFFKRAEWRKFIAVDATRFAVVDTLPGFESIKQYCTMLDSQKLQYALENTEECSEEEFNDAIQSVANSVSRKFQIALLPKLIAS